MKLFYLATFAGAALAVPQGSTPSQCTSPKLRKSWAAATDAEKAAYLSAAVCITELPSRLGNSGETLHDDFALVHAILAQDIHFFPGFLPWHRFFLQVYENALRDECGYTGAAMYWDWVADSSAPSQSVIWDPVTGFGGNGVQTGDNGRWKRVVDGPFRNYRPVYWNIGVEQHWLSRDWVGSDGPYEELNRLLYTPEAIAEVNSTTVYDQFRNALENNPHAAIHGGVGGGTRGFGDMGFHDASPNDPLFFVHHGQVDRLWWLWQQDDPNTRTFEYNGMQLDNETPVSLNDMMPMAGLAGDGVVRDYMDTQGGTLCYTY